jgi:hypothetical protein
MIPARAKKSKKLGKTKTTYRQMRNIHAIIVKNMKNIHLIMLKNFAIIFPQAQIKIFPQAPIGARSAKHHV